MSPFTIILKEILRSNIKFEYEPNIPSTKNKRITYRIKQKDDRSNPNVKINDNQWQKEYRNPTPARTITYKSTIVVYVLVERKF